MSIELADQLLDLDWVCVLVFGEPDFKDSSLTNRVVQDPG